MSLKEELPNTVSTPHKSQPTLLLWTASITTLLLIITIVAVYTWRTPNQFPDEKQPLPPEKVVELTPEEVQVYRKELPTDTIFYPIPEDEALEPGSTIEPIRPTAAPTLTTTTNSEASTTSVTPTPTETTTPTQKAGISRQGISNISTTPVPVPPDLLTANESADTQTNDSAEAISITSTGEGTVTVTDPTQVGEKQQYTLQGVVYQISPEDKYLTMFDDASQKQYYVRISATTKIFITNKPTTLSTIQPGDIVYVEGEGYETSDTLQASSVNVTGTEELMIIAP